MASYFNPAMKQLTDQQVRYAPVKVRLEQIGKAEKLLEKLDPEESYAYQDICEQITAYRPEMYPDLQLSGKEAVHDLRLFVEDLSDSANIDVDTVEEPVLTVQDVSERYNVSTKTVDRWRSRGLVSRRFVFGKRKRIGFLQSSVERFVDKHSDDVDRGRNFSQLNEDERRVIIRRARRLVRFGASPSEVSRRLSRKTNRSPETIRYTLKSYDKEHPESPIFPNSSAPLTDENKGEIFRAFRAGTPAELLASRYHRTKTSIYRIVSEVRSRLLTEQKIDYMYNEEFEFSNANETILGPPPEVEKKKSTVKVPPGLPPYLASLYSIPLLTREEEAYYFRKMNFLKHKAAKLQEEGRSTGMKSDQMEKIEALLDQAQEVKNFLIRSNLRLVVSIAKRHIKPNTNFFEVVSDGNMSLIRAIEKFDYSKGNKFSTYSTWAIMKNFARSIPAEHTRLDRFRTGIEEVFNNSSDNRANHFHEEIVNQEQNQLIMGILDHLDDREKDIILFRYGLNTDAEPQTLEQVGNHFGVTKERIRQLEQRALKKMRKAVQSEKLDIPGI
ncbi:MAG: RNA polymerase subunit sigma-70 [Planctomycetaceae bacterium]|nr:RNA polymerase subunit sigma-70 [Planctomycetaceae bacterium]